jgi:hypothetical protein
MARIGSVDRNVVGHYGRLLWPRRSGAHLVAAVRASGHDSQDVSVRNPMREKSRKCRPQDCDAALASDDGPIFSTVAKPVDALKRSIPEGTQNA